MAERPAALTDCSRPPPAPTNSSSACTGRSYTIKAGDTCQSISKAQQIGTNWLLTDNSLPAYCAGFPTSGLLCLNHTCPTYTVRANDTCNGIASTYNLTIAQFFTWNPVIDVACSNLNKSLGHEICIGSPGPKYTAPTTSLAPPADDGYIARAGSHQPRKCTVTNCGMYYEAVRGDYCNLLLLRFGLSLTGFQILNPEINEK